MCNNPINLTDPTGRDENPHYSQVAVVVNRSNQTVWIAFDADGMGPGGANLEARIPLKPGESLAKYTPDADAVIVGPGQKIDGETKGAFKVRWGTFTITKDKKGNLTMSTPTEYKLHPKAGYGAKPPKQ